MILIATCSEYPHPTPNLEALVSALKAQGMDAAYLPWKTTPLETFAAAEAALPLCCWDYYDDPGRFLAWIDALEAKGARLLNPPELLRWNFRKTYLLEMAEAGLAVPKTFHLPEANRQAIAQRMEAEGWSVAVAKPVSSQSGHGVQKIDWSNIDRWPTGEMLLQEYQHDIGALGETTMTFIDGTFSHAVRRVLKAGEWRANAQYGTTYERVTVSQDVIDTAKSYLDLLPQTPLYARVDGLVRSTGFMLMELELIDPYLYLEFAPGSADVMVRAVLQRLG
ncbi:RimK family alpha-L-glutamate ligase [Microvirga arabica]|uniref:RimK family alpha-L-glutamate ligase n=1 Tax=Microvirga arabica TaxID=1128671 RepID=A0ABV6YCI6_9HYPH